MSQLRLLPSDEFLALMKSYQENHPATAAIEALDAEVEQRAYEQLAIEWQNGWDFCTITEFFGDRGVSILIQNGQVSWRQVWDWLISEYPAIPDGAMINFEVWDSIQKGLMIAGDMQIRRLILSSGVYAEQTNAEQADAGNGLEPVPDP